MEAAPVQVVRTYNFMEWQTRAARATQLSYQLELVRQRVDQSSESHTTHAPHAPN